jgi:hypothetical protein
VSGKQTLGPTSANITGSAKHLPLDENPIKQFENGVRMGKKIISIALKIAHNGYKIIFNIL